MNKITISGVIGFGEVDADEIINQLESFNGDLVVELDSVGGSVVSGIKIANAIRDYRAKGNNVEILGGAVVASIATYIAMQGTSFTVRDNTTFMIHNAYLPVIGDYVKLRKMAEISEGLSTILAKDYSKKSKIDEKEIKALMSEESYYYGMEIKEKGFADEMKDTETDLDKNAAMALTIETLKACNNAIIANENVSFEMVAQMLPSKDEANPIEVVENQKEEIEEVQNSIIDLTAKQKRERTINLLKRK